MHWEEKYSKNFKEFFAKIISWNPDYIVPVARKACKLLKVAPVDIKIPSEKIFFRKYFEFCKPDLRGKKIAIFDDSANYGSTLFEHKDFFKNMDDSAEIECFAFVAKKSNVDGIDGGFFYESNPTIGILLSNQGYLEYLINQREFLLSFGEHLDIDHLLLQLELTSPSNLEEIAYLLQTIGNIYFIESNNKDILKFTLDFPNLFERKELEKLSKVFEFNGISKIRFFLDNAHKKLSICPMVFPSFKPNVLAEQNNFSILPNNTIIDLISNITNSNEARYMCFSLELGTLIATRLLSLIRRYNYLDKEIENLKVNNGDFRRFFGNDYGEKISEQLRKFIITTSQPDYFSGNYTNTPLIVQSQKIKSKEDYTDYLHNGYLKAKKETGKIIGIHFTKTFQELCGITGEPQEVLSEMLDYDCDNGVVIPCIENKGGKNLWVRSYRTGENKEDIAWERTKYYVPLIIDSISRDLKCANNVVPTMLVTKTLANFVVDYPKEQYESAHLFDITPFTYGPEPSVCHRRHTRNRTIYLHMPESLGNKYTILKDEEDNTIGFAAAGDWKDGWEEWFTDKYDVEVPESEIHLYLDFLLDIYKAFGNKSETLNRLAIGRNFEWFYWFPYSNLEYWTYYIDQFLDHFKDFDYNDFREGKWLSRSANGCVQAKQKIDNYEEIDELIQTLIARYGDTLKYRKFIERLTKQREKFSTNQKKISQLGNICELQHSFSVLIQNTLSTLKGGASLADSNERFMKHFNKFKAILSTNFPAHIFTLEDYIKTTKNLKEYKSLLKELCNKIKNQFYILSEPIKYSAIHFKSLFKFSANEVVGKCKEHNIAQPIFVFADYTGYLASLNVLERNRQDKDAYFKKFIEIITSIFKSQDGVQFYKGPTGDDYGYIFENKDAAFLAIATCYEKLEAENKTLDEIIPPYIVKFGMAQAQITSIDEVYSMMSSYKLAWESSQYKPRFFPNHCLIPDTLYKILNTKQQGYFKKLDDEPIKAIDQNDTNHILYLFDGAGFIEQTRE